MWLDLFPRETELLLRPVSADEGGDLIRQIQPTIRIATNEAEISQSQVGRARLLFRRSRGLTERQLSALLAACDRIGY